jgi:hypothetical protein
LFPEKRGERKENDKIYMRQEKYREQEESMSSDVLSVLL